MLFGRSLFESVLVRMEEENPPEEEAGTESPRIRGFTSGFVAPAMEGISVSLHRIDGAYLDLAEDPVSDIVPENGEADAQDAAPPPLPDHLSRQLPAEIAADLGLAQDDSLETLAEKRRVFARNNHPDLVHPAHREAANARMTTANLLVDQAISRLIASRKLGLL